MNTFKSSQSGSLPTRRLDKTHRKLALALWVKMQHSPPEQLFNILLTLTKAPDEREIRQLQDWGLQLSDFHTQQPGTILPGVMTRAHLEKYLLHCDFVRYIEGIAHTNDLIPGHPAS